MIDQLKQLHFDGSEYNTNILISSSPHPPGLTTWQIVSKFGNYMEMTTSSFDELPNTQIKNNMFEITPDYTFQKSINKLTDKFKNLDNHKNDEIR